MTAVFFYIAVSNGKTTDKTVRAHTRFPIPCTCGRGRFTIERGAARVLTPGVSWVCAQAADPHIASKPASGCSNQIQKANGAEAHAYLASRLSKVKTSPAVSVF
jgi:hypothetical protein